MTPNSRVLHMTACGGITAMLLLCSYTTIQRGLASLYAYPGKNSVAMWQEGKRHLRQQDWKKARASLEKALSYDGHNPDLLHDLGTSIDAEVAYYPPGYNAVGKNRNNARQYYLDALAGRPTWPYDWMALALVKYRLDQVDVEFNRAIHRALALGPWEPSVKLMVTDIGMHHWDKLDHDMRAIVTGIIRYAVNHRDTATAMLTLVKRYDRQDLVCTGASKSEQIMQYCEKYNRD